MRLQGNRGIRCLATFGVVCALLFSACGEEEDKDDDSDGASTPDITQAGFVGVTKASADSVELSFEGAEAGAQFVVMPYTVGNPATVDGAGAETLEISLTVPAAAAGGGLNLDEPKYNPAAPLTGREYDLGVRLLWNRFDRTKGQDQGEWFWKLAEQLDLEGSRFRPQPKSFNLQSAMPLSEGFAKLADAKPPQQDFNLAAQASECPSTVPIPQFADETAEVLDPATDVVAGEGYCLVYLSDPDSVTGGTKDEVSATMAAVVKRYKEVIYGDTFADIGAYKFIPTLVIVDVTDDSVWNTQLVLSGVHSSEISTTANRPLVFIASDFSVIPALQATEAAALKRLWHGTVAHEMQHAVMDYYRGKSGGNAETIAVDEGIAHFMEDVFGYGEENFPIYSGAAISLFPDGLEPIIKGSGVAPSEVNSASARGAAAAFIYYLQSQKGGVTFTDGVVSGGGGFDYVKAVVKSTGTIGTQSLKAPFTEDWVEVVGGYLAAMVLDGTTIEPESGAYQAQNPIAGITCLNGATDKTFGMSFNGYLGNINRITEGSYESINDQEGAIEVNQYMTYPTLYEVADPAAKITVGFPDATGAGVSVVRIK